MRRIGLVVAVVAVMGVSGCRLAESRIVAGATRLAQACAFGIARGVVPKDPADFVRRPAPIRVEPAAAVLASDVPRRSAPVAIVAPAPAEETEVLRIPVSRDLTSVYAAADRARRARCTAIASAGAGDQTPTLG